MVPVWETHRHRLGFGPGEPIRYRETKVPRFRVTDYLRAIGVDLDRVVEVHLHGARDGAIVLTRDDLRRHPDGILFKFAGDTFGKPIPIVREVPTGTTFDDLKAMAIYVARTPPALTPAQSLVLDGAPVRGIPYHGEPIRNGVRVYVDDRLTAILKRNELAAPADGRYRLADVLARQGVATEPLVRAQLIRNEERAGNLAVADLEFRFEQSGQITFGADGQPVEAIALYSR
jgi:hypothetical protein